MLIDVKFFFLYKFVNKLATFSSIDVTSGSIDVSFLGLLPSVLCSAEDLQYTVVKCSVPTV